MKFQELDINKKIEHLLLILEEMKGFNERVDNLINDLKDGKIQDNSELDKLYELTIESIKESNQEVENERINTFKNNQNLISYLKQKEAEERQKEIENLEIDF